MAKSKKPSAKKASKSSHEIQRYGDLASYPLALADRAKEKSVDSLNRVLAETFVIRDMYKKHHWQVSGPTFESLHLLFDKHFTEQTAIVDLVAERVQTLGGISIAMPHDVVELSTLPRAPKGREEPVAQIERLLGAHEHILKLARTAARSAADSGDDGTNDMLVGGVIRVHEMQVWFLNAHLTNVHIVHRK